MLLPFFEWCEKLWLGRVVVGSMWLFPVIEAVHLLALSVLGGAVLVVDLRLLGTRAEEPQPAGTVARRAAVDDWRAGGDDRHRRAAVPVGTDQVLLQQSFWVKMTALPIAIAVRVHDPRARDRGRPYVTQRAARPWSARCRLRCGSPSPRPAAGSGFRNSISRISYCVIRSLSLSARRGFFGAGLWPSVGSAPSFGAPVPDEPMNSLRPSVNVTSRPLARFSEWSLVW